MLVATYKTKKALKASVGQSLDYQETSIYGPEYKADGTFSVVGPTMYKRNWFAEVTMADGRIAKVA